jgi:hypothetical protein
MVLLALSVLLSLPACAQIPTSGPVVEGAEVDTTRDDQFIRVIARPPLPGMTADQVVRGFLEASAAFQGNYAVARTFLTDVAGATWKPEAGVQVYDGASSALSPTAKSTAVFTAPLVGRISPEGDYQVTAPGATLRAEFGLSRVDGEWRISRVPEGLLLSRGDVERGYRTFDVYYLDPDFSTLVPDPITLRVSGPGLATALVRALLKGATPWLAPAVRTAFPDGTSLAIDSVPVEGGVAQVSLDAGVLAADDRTREALSAQLVTTLGALPDVTGVRITAGGQPLLVPGQGAVQGRDAWPQFSPDNLPVGAQAYLVRGGRLLAVDDGTPKPVAGAAGSVKPAVGVAAVSFDGVESAVVSPDRRTLWGARLVTGAVATVRATGNDLVTPGFGRDGSVWWVDRGSGVRLLRPGGKPVGVPVARVDARNIVGIQVARDGTRAALVVRNGSRRTLLLVRIDRTGGVVTMAAPIRVESRISDVIDVAWSTASRLVVLGSDGAGPAQAFLVDVGHGTARPIGAPTSPSTVAAAPGRLLLIGAEDGLVWEYQSGRWLGGSKGTSPTYPG